MQEEDRSFQIQILIFVIILVTYIIFSHFIEIKRWKYLHESTIAIILGLITAIASKQIANKQISFSGDLFFGLLVPPMVFAIGFGIRQNYFFQNFGKIMFLGVFGSLCQFTILAFSLSLLNSYLNLVNTVEILLLCSVLCSSDPSPTFSIIRKDRHAALHSIVMGENILNTAVAIILFRIARKIETQGQFQLQWGHLAEICLSFLYLFLCSIALGIFFGLILSYGFKKFVSFSSFPLKEVSLILLVGYFTFHCGQIIGLSGIISLFTSSIVFTKYGFENLSHQSKKVTGLAFETVKYIIQGFVFTYLGASLLLILDTSKLGMSLLFGTIILILLIVIRFSFIGVLVVFWRLRSKIFVLSSSETKMLFYSNTMRGVISFALALQVHTSNFHNVIIPIIFVVLTTTVLGATFLKPFASFINFSNEFEFINYVENISVVFTQNIERKESSPVSKYDTIGKEIQQQSNVSPKTEAFKSFEEKFVKPIFIRQQNTSNQQKSQDYEMKNISIQNKKMEI